MWTWIVAPASDAAFDNPRAASSESQFTVSLRMRDASAASRCHFTSPTTGYAMQISSIPASAKGSASLTLAQTIPRAPAAICIRAISGILWVLMCDRNWTLHLSACACHSRMFLSKTVEINQGCGGVQIVDRRPSFRRSCFGDKANFALRSDIGIAPRIQSYSIRGKSRYWQTFVYSAGFSSGKQ